MKFNTDKPVKIVLLGAGGTGGHIAPHLYRLMFSLDRYMRIIIADGDVVEQKNLVRQNFVEADLGENKARVLAERYSAVFGMEAEYIPSFIEDRETLKNLVMPRKWSLSHYEHERGEVVHDPVLKTRDGIITELVILIGAVDNNRSRQLCDSVFKEVSDLVYIDSGNGEHTGQVVCGIRSGDRTYYKPVGGMYPDVLEVIDKFPTELSCAEASVSAPQSIVANIMAATAVVNFIYNILVLGDTSVRQVTFSTGSINIRPTITKKRRKAA